MKINSALKSLLVIGALLGSASVYANETTSSIVSHVSHIQQPIVPAGTDPTSLPASGKEGNTASPQCYAAYLIEKIAFNVDRDDRSSRDDRDRDEREVRFKVRVTNLGECALTDLFVKDFFPEGTRLTRAYPRPDFFEFRSAEWTIPYLEVNQRVSIDLEFKVERDDDYRSRDRRADGRWVTNNACVWNAMVGKQACAWASTWLDCRSEMPRS